MTHSIYRAYEIVLGKVAPKGAMILNRSEISHALKLKAVDIHLDRIKRPEAGEEQKAAANLLYRAYRILVDTLGSKDAVLVTKAEDENVRQEQRA